MSDQDINQGPGYRLNDPNEAYNFNYSKQTTGDLPDFFGPFLETYNKDGSLRRRQFRGGHGQVGANIVSGGKYVQEVSTALQHVLRESFLANYDRLIGHGRGSEQTGTLRRAVASGEFTDEEMLEGFSMAFQIADLMRSRGTRNYGRFSQRTTDLSTRRYGPVIFQGRKAIVSTGPMIFPGYPGGQMVWMKPGKFVRGTMPADIFKLEDAQKSAVVMAVMQPLKDIVSQYIKSSVDQNQ